MDILLAAYYTLAMQIESHNGYKSECISIRTHSRTHILLRLSELCSLNQRKTQFSTLDVIKAFYNIHITEDSQMYTAFTSNYSMLCCTRMAFDGKYYIAVQARASGMIHKSNKDTIEYADDIFV